jgi:outer membrane receptor protein involved in Fe transport
MKGVGYAAVAAAAFVLPAAEAGAQTATPSAQTPAASAQAPAGRPAQGGAQRTESNATVEAVTVTAERSDTRVSIDRRSYSIASDLQSTAGSIGDALRNVPSVQVDLEGNLTLRGDSNVTIMIDGKPSGMFRGEGRATALQQLPADQFERVEVMTNPSAAMRPDGSAGVINLISKKDRAAGQTGSVRVAVGNEGRYNGGASYAYNSKTFGVNASASVWHDERETTWRDERSRLYDNRFRDSRSLSESVSRSDGYNLRGGVDYDPDAATRISAELRLNKNENENTSVGSTSGLDSEGQLINDATTTGLMRNSMSNGEASLGYRRKFTGHDHVFTLDVSQERTDRAFEADFHVVAHPPIPAPYTASDRGELIDKTEAKAEYKRPVGAEDRLVAGYNLEITQSAFDVWQSRGTEPFPTTPDLRYTYELGVEQAVHGVYGTYEHAMGDFTVLSGLRLELTDLEAHQLTADVRGGYDYWKAYPSLHLQHEITDNQQITAGYSRRIQRPRPEDLNPAIQYRDPFNFRQGNPRLRPQETDSFELIWQRRENGRFLLATGYWRESRNGVTDVTRDIGGGVLLTTRENLTGSRSGGLELVANGRLGDFRYNLSGNGYWTEVEGETFGVTQVQSGWTYQGNFSVTWQATPKDDIQFSGYGRGRQYTPQGYQEASGALNLAYRHRFNKNWMGVVQVNDLLESQRSGTIIDTPVLRARTDVDWASRAIFFSLRYSFGSAAGSRRPQMSDEAPPAAGPF